MRCAKCQSDLGRISSGGEVVLRTRGLVLKAEGLTAICPKCKQGVPVSGDMRKALLVFLAKPACLPSSSS